MVKERTLRQKAFRWLLISAAFIVIYQPACSYASTGSLISATYDTGYTKGVAFNTISWHGALGTGSSSVGFQFASSNCPNGSPNSNCVGGTWKLTGPDDTTNTYYFVSPNSTIHLVGAYYDNDRYYRYEVFLNKSGTSTSPKVSNIVVNWSP